MSVTLPEGWLDHDAMAAVLTGGGSVNWQGRTIRSSGDLPSDAEILAQSVAPADTSTQTDQVSHSALYWVLAAGGRLYDPTTATWLTDPADLPDAADVPSLPPQLLIPPHAAQMLAMLPLAATTWKTASCTSTSTAVWTPASGKKVRLLGYSLELTANATVASGAVITAELRDGASTPIGRTHSLYVPTSAITGLGAQSVSFGLGPRGILSSAVDLALTVVLSAALTAGALRVHVYGIEE